MTGDKPELPTMEVALAMLQQLAGDFLFSDPPEKPRASAATNEAELPRAAMVVLDERSAIVGLDSEAERLLGRGASELTGRPATALFGPLPVTTSAIRSRIILADGTESFVWITRADATVDGSRRTILTLHDADSADVRKSELRYRHLVEQIPAVVFSASLDGGLYDIFVSPQIEQLLGYTQAEWAASPVLWYDRLHPEDRRRLDLEFARGCSTGGGNFRADCRFLTRDDKIVWVHGEARLIRDTRGQPLLLQGVAFDITETKRAEEIANASLREKETLLKEIHHRVKNNLQVTSSLLRLQASHVKDEVAKTALRAGQDRIRSMALVHELLYRSKDLSRIDLGDYIRDLTRHLLRSHGTESSAVRINTELAAVPMPVDVAVPCGLILNELVSNALEHAFPAGQKGTILIALRSSDAHDELVVKDDGIGIAPGAETPSGPTLGLRLVHTLAEQIGASLTVQTRGGTEVSLRVPHRGGGR